MFSQGPSNFDQNGWLSWKLICFKFSEAYSIDSLNLKTFLKLSQKPQTNVFGENLRPNCEMNKEKGVRLKRKEIC